MTALRYEPCKKRAKQHRLCASSHDVFHSISAWLVAMLTFHLLNYRLFFVSVWIVLLPSPGIFAHLFDAILSLPAKFLLCQRSIGIAGGDIATCYSDASLAEKELGWKAENGIKEMCEDSWRWQKNNPNGYEE